MKVLRAWNKQLFRSSVNFDKDFLERFTLGNSLEGISFLTKTIRPSSCFFLSSQHDCVNSFRMNDSEGTSNFVSDVNKISSLLPPSLFLLLKVNNRNTRTIFEICSKLIIKTPERHHWRCSGVVIVNFKQISHIVPVFILLTLNK